MASLCACVDNILHRSVGRSSPVRKAYTVYRLRASLRCHHAGLCIVLCINVFIELCQHLGNVPAMRPAGPWVRRTTVRVDA